MSVHKKIRRFASRTGISRASWSAYSSAVHLTSRQCDRDYIADGVKIAAVSSERAAELLEVINSCPHRPLTVEDYAPGYQHNASIGKLLDDLNESFISYDLSGRPLTAIRRLCEEIDPEVRSCFGGPWKVVAAKAARTHAATREIGRNVWHSDHFPAGLHKILIYLTPPSLETGTTEVRLRTGAVKTVEGPPGTYLLFNPTELSHRGIPPVRGERVSIDLTVVPSFFSGLDPVYPGQNGAYPEFPWGKRGLAVKN